MAQLVEQRIRNAQVVGSSPTSSSMNAFPGIPAAYAGSGFFHALVWVFISAITFPVWDWIALTIPVALLLSCNSTLAYWLSYCLLCRSGNDFRLLKKVLTDIFTLFNFLISIVQKKTTGFINQITIAGQKHANPIFFSMIFFIQRLQ